MQATISAWLMATLTTSALMVALVQSASTAPTLLFGLFAGTLADIVDRRHVIIVTQVLLFIASLILGSAALFGIIGPASLLFLTFLVGAGFTFYLPAQQASINELVSRAGAVTRRCAWLGRLQRRARARARARGGDRGRVEPGKRTRGGCVLLRADVRRDAPHAAAGGRAARCARTSAVRRDDRAPLRAPLAADARTDRSQPEHSACARARSGHCCR